MPQLDIFTFGSQIFWFTSVFWGLYLILFNSFIFPYSFIGKVRAYLSIIIPKISNAAAYAKFSFSSSYNSLLSAVIILSSEFYKNLSSSHSTNLEFFISLIDNSVESFFEETDFLAADSYVFLKASRI